MSSKAIKTSIVLLCLLALTIPTSAKAEGETPTPPSTDAFVSTEASPASLPVGETAMISVKLNNVPVEGYKSAEFTCTYNPGMVEKSNITIGELFGVDPVSAIHDPQNGNFIVAIAGANSNRAITSGAAFTFSAKGLQVGPSSIQCTARVSKGDNLPIDLLGIAADLTILGVEVSPTSSVPATAMPGGHDHPSATTVPESPTPALNSSLSGQLLASKPVTVRLLDANQVEISSAFANPDGTFLMTPLPGDYTLVATASGFLSYQEAVSIPAGNPLVLPATSLLAGDVDGNNVIDQFDALTIGMNYTASTPEAADLNNDIVIDFLDLELLAENYRQTGPTSSSSVSLGLKLTAVPGLTRTHVPGSKQTLVPGLTQTSVPSPKQTALPGLTETVAAPIATPITGPGQPYAEAPLCPTHDPTTWHSLWDSARGCHYDHEHGDDPSLADSYFGRAGAQWGGQMISYPFATSAMENTHKHGGYKYSIMTPEYHPWPSCGINAVADNSQTGNNCIVASRVEYHIVGGTMDSLSRVHSYYMEAYICKYPDYRECGIIRIGGHADFAELKAPHYSTRIVRPGGTVDFGNGIVMDYAADGADLPAMSGEPYVFMIPYSAAEPTNRLNNPPSAPATMDQWSMQDLNDCEPKPANDPCHNKFARFMAQVGDSWNLLDTQNPNNIRWICKGQPGCQYNGSLIGLNEIGFLVLQSWESSGNGFVTLNGFTDRWGNPRFDGACTSVSVDCVPLALEHAPVGYAASNMNMGCRCDVYEHDIYFNNQPSNWIQFPN